MSTLYVIQAADYSGAETAQLPVLRADPEALVACPAGSRTEALVRDAGARTVPLRFRVMRHSGGLLTLARSVPAGLRSARELRVLLRAQPERRVVYGTSLRPSLLAAVAALGLRRRTVWVLTDFMPPGALGSVIRSLAAATRPRVVAHSSAIAASFAAGRKRLADLVTVVHPAVDIEHFAAVAPLAGVPRVGVFGHISPTKRTDLAVEVAARLPEAQFEIVGAAQYREEDFAFEQALRRRVADDPDLAARVRFRGRLEDIRGALGDVSVVLHCRADEPFGMVLVEAMAAGRPVVAPAAAGPLEIVEHGVTGLLYPPGDAGAAAARVSALLADPARARAMGRAARAAAIERFGAERHNRRIAQLLMGSSRREAPVIQVPAAQHQGEI